MILVMVFKILSMTGCSISVVNMLDGMSPILLDFMPLGSMILELFPCLLYMIIGSYQGRLFGFVTGTRASEGSRAVTQAQYCSALSEVILCHQGEATDATFLTS